MKSRQFCSVCKEWLEMEVVPTGDGEEDDGVIWFRCPQCQGFLPKLGGGEPESGTEEPESPVATGPAEVPSSPLDEALPWDSPADMMASRGKPSDVVGDPGPVDAAPTETDAGSPSGASSPEAKDPAEPIPEYAALLAEKGQGEATPYRPWETYEVGQCIHHQAWEECGVVVAKEKLPGGRLVIKCYFEEAGVVRLIEQAPR